ncbi:MAG: hypothetical protein IPM55_16580 [Acidobacteria bacterium]|nr:hypothetical protein [Acidobacteriota bacterium]
MDDLMARFLLLDIAHRPVDLIISGRRGKRPSRRVLWTPSAASTPRYTGHNGAPSRSEISRAACKR